MNVYAPLFGDGVMGITRGDNQGLATISHSLSQVTGNPAPEPFFYTVVPLQEGREAARILSGPDMTLRSSEMPRAVGYRDTWAGQGISFPTRGRARGRASLQGRNNPNTIPLGVRRPRSKIAQREANPASTSTGADETAPTGRQPNIELPLNAAVNSDGNAGAQMNVSSPIPGGGRSATISNDSRGLEAIKSAMSQISDRTGATRLHVVLMPPRESSEPVSRLEDAACVPPRPDSTVHSNPLGRSVGHRDTWAEQGIPTPWDRAGPRARGYIRGRVLPRAPMQT